MNSFKCPAVSINELLLITAAYFTLIFNFPFLDGFLTAIWQLPKVNYLFLVSVPLLLFCLLSLLFSLVGIKYLVKPILIAVVLSSALVFYGEMAYGVVFDYGMIQNSFETDPAEAFSYINWLSVGVFLLFGVTPALLILCCPIRQQAWHKELFDRTRLIAFSLVGISLIAGLFYQDYASVGRNNNYLKKYLIPSQYLSSGFKYIKRNYIDQPIAFVTLDNTPKDTSPKEKEVMVLIVGETARAANFSVNGYTRDTNSHTNPFSLVSFKHMYACGTATAVSVPCMFSALTRENFSRRRADNQQNLLDLLSLAGVDVLWIDNNGCKGVCKRVNTLSIEPTPVRPLCDGEYCQDEVLIQPLKNKLTSLEHNKTIVVLHMLGSHGPTYFKRYPQEHRKFTPDCPRSDIQNCTHEQLVNTYDNTINYTDFVISEAIKSLDDVSDDYRKTLVYVSDHGESLGESGVYLHGFPYAFSPVEQRHIPMLMWSDTENLGCVSQLAEQNDFSHDHIFHSVLGRLSISSTAYEPDLDIFSQCSAASFANSRLPTITGNPSDDI